MKNVLKSNVVFVLQIYIKVHLRMYTFKGYLHEKCHIPVLMHKEEPDIAVHDKVTVKMLMILEPVKFFTVFLHSESYKLH